MATTVTRQSYCLCSETTLGELVDRQTREPLPFSLCIDRHTRCNEGCRSCVKKLRRLLIEAEVFIEDPPCGVLADQHSKEAVASAATIKE